MQMTKIIFLLLAGAILFAGCSDVESADKKAADFSLQNLQDKTVRLSDYEGDVILLNFFATWCPPCRDEIPDFIEIVKDYGDRHFTIIAVSLDKGGVETVRNFANEHGINYPVLLDDGLVSKTYGPIRSIPTTFIIDKDGNIEQKIIGARDKGYFENIIKPLL